MTERPETEPVSPAGGGATRRTRRLAMSERDVATLRSLADRIDPADAGAHNNLGVVFYQKGLVDEAVAAFQRALELDPRLAVARRNAEIAFTESGHFDRRVRELREALAEDPADTDARDALARVHLLGGHPEDAAREWETLLERHPSSTALHMKLAYARAEAGRTGEARALLESAARLSPELSAVRLQLAELLFDAGRLDRAERAARRALELDETNARAHAFLGKLLEHTGRTDEAEAARQRARELDPKAVDPEGHLSLERYRSAREAGSRARSEADADPDPVEGPLGSYARATELRQAGDLDGARRELEAAVERGDGTPEIRQALAEIHLLEGAAAPAAAAYEALLAEQDDSPKLWNERGVALHRLGRVGDAVAAYRRAVALDREYRLGWNNLGVGYAQSGDPARAEEALGEAASREAPPEVLWNLGLFHAQHGRDDDAVAAYRAAVDADPSSAESWSRLGGALFQLRRPEAARDALVEALDRDPDKVEARYYLGFVLSALGDFAGALRETRRALEQEPVLPPPRYQLLIDVQFEAGTIAAPHAEGAERATDAAVPEFDFDPSALDEAFEALEPSRPAPGPEIGVGLERVRAALRRGQLDRAADRIARVVARAPGDSRARLLEAEILLRRGFAGEALERFDVVLSARPDRSQRIAAREGKARALLALDRPTEAVEAARTARKIGGSAGLYAEALLADGHDEPAVAAYEEAMAGGETGPTVLEGYARALLSAGRLEAAEQALRRALRQGGSARARVGLGRALRAQGREEEARTAYRAAVRTLPSYAPAALELAELEWDAGRTEEAVRALVDLLSLDPVQIEALVRLGDWLARLGRRDQARRALRRALSLAPGHTDAGRLLSELTERQEG